MGDVMVTDAAQPAESSKMALKRKREKLHGDILTPEETGRRIQFLNQELNSLFKYFTEVLGDSDVGLESHFEICPISNVNGMIALLLEEKNASYSKLVNVIYERVKKRDDGVTIAGVKSSVLYVGQRVLYGVPIADVDVLEDESDSALWCWETRDMKLLPNSVRGMLKIRRTCRKKINERITAVLAAICALQRPPDDQLYKTDLIKASERLNKSLTESDIRLLVETMFQKKSPGWAEKEAKREEKILIKQLEKNKREVEKEKKRMEREIQKEKLQNEKDSKCSQLAEKDEKQRHKEESEMRKQLKRKQEEAERDQRRREKEEAELKKQRSIQKQASILERFLKKSKSAISESDQVPTSTTASDASAKREYFPDAVTFSMDSALFQKDDIDVGEIRISHLNLWRSLGHSIRARGQQHWGIRRKPKSTLIKEIKLCDSKGLTRYEDLSIESLVNTWEEAHTDDKSCRGDLSGSLPAVLKPRLRKQLLQFDKSHRPAFYGVWPKKSSVVRPHQPLKKDPELDYENDSDEEWEEEDPGESLSDCDKDGEESPDEASVKAEDEDENDDGFFVPDGYLSENEGIENDRDGNLEAEDAKSSPCCKPDAESEELSAWIRQQKYLYKLTEHALRKNQPLVITNLLHEKVPFTLEEDLVGAVKLEQMCLQALAMHAFPGALPVEVRSDNILLQDDQEAQLSNSKGSTVPTATSATILDSDLHIMVSVIQSCPQGMTKLLESLHQKFPDIPKSHLKNKVREISDFVDNHWQVKKEVMGKLGIQISPEKVGGRSRSIAAFFSKRCLPPSGRSVSHRQTPSPSSMKTGLGSSQQM